MYTKDFAARVKAAGEADGLGDGEFTAVVSVFGNVDSYGDVVRRGAFTDTLTAWADSGDPIPVIWSHDWSDPYSHLGTVTKAEETDDGLRVTGQLDMAENPKAQQVYRLLKGRRVTQFSFAYDIEDAGLAEKDGDDVLELRKLSLFEVGPCLVGANQETELVAVKAHELAMQAKSGRVLAQKHLDGLKAAHTAIGEVIAAAEPDNADTAEAGDHLAARIEAGGGEPPALKSSPPPDMDGGGSQPRTDDAAGATQEAGQPDSHTAHESQTRASASSAEQSQSTRSAQAAARLRILKLGATP